MLCLQLSLVPHPKAYYWPPLKVKSYSIVMDRLSIILLYSHSRHKINRITLILEQTQTHILLYNSV